MNLSSLTAKEKVSRDQCSFRSDPKKISHLTLTTETPGYDSQYECEMYTRDQVTPSWMPKMT